VQARERYLRWVGWGAMLFSGEASAEYIWAADQRNKFFTPLNNLRDRLGAV
jgi:hypothetical protein